MSFDETLARGRLGENLIARYLNARGCHILPAYEIEIPHGKGPRLFLADGRKLITPDQFVFLPSGRAYWLEAKTKTAFAWFRINQAWQTGIDAAYWKDYQQVRKLTPNFDLYLMFLHLPGRAKDTPDGMVSPDGLYWDTIERLESHVIAGVGDDTYGKGGMVYWREQDLHKECDYATFLSVTGVSDYTLAEVYA
jgi:hypothetical protein